MNRKTTQRGFVVLEFKDSYNVECSMQKSSRIAGEEGEYIWLGCNNPNPRTMTQGGWKNLELPAVTVCNTRMHLSQKQAKKLIVQLQQFVYTGEL